MTRSKRISTWIRPYYAMAAERVYYMHRSADQLPKHRTPDTLAADYFQLDCKRLVKSDLVARISKRGQCCPSLILIG